jgi:hypothetical protein
MGILFFVLLTVTPGGEGTVIEKTVVDLPVLNEARPSAMSTTEQTAGAQVPSGLVPKAGLGVKTDFAAGQMYGGLTAAERSKASELRLARNPEKQAKTSAASEPRRDRRASRPLTLMERIKARLLGLEPQEPERRPNADVD